METLLWASAIIWCLLTINGTLNYLLNGKLTDAADKDLATYPKVSIIVPARNEEQAIENSVTSFCEQEYPAEYEVIVVDDESTDSTPAILEKLKRKYPHLKVVKGSGPAKGWLGKPAALERGVKEAAGDCYLFADADIWYSEGLLKLAVNYMAHKNADFMTLGPRVVTKGVFEAALMSNIYFVGGCIFPGYLVERTKTPLFSIGAGVFNLIKKELFIKTGAFGSIKDRVVDDVMLGYMAKKAGGKAVVTQATEHVSVRMYDGAMETIKGFRKNMFPALKKAPFLIPLPFVLGSIVSFVPYIGLIYNYMHSGTISTPAVISLVLMHWIFFSMFLVFRQPWYVTFLNPIRELGWWAIFAASFMEYYRRGGVHWRGRTFK
ncbi:MAG: glycosyltransferase [Deltaproteobacteria bacterium]|nr:glycosyltransferase [Deltaproteobacteria bacterium]